MFFFASDIEVVDMTVEVSFGGFEADVLTMCCLHGIFGHIWSCS